MRLEVRPSAATHRAISCAAMIVCISRATAQQRINPRRRSVDRAKQLELGHAPRPNDHARSSALKRLRVAPIAPGIAADPAGAL
jgi:hypothetical protein